MEKDLLAFDIMYNRVLNSFKEMIKQYSDSVCSSSMTSIADCINLSFQKSAIEINNIINDNFIDSINPLMEYLNTYFDNISKGMNVSLSPLIEYLRESLSSDEFEQDFYLMSNAIPEKVTFELSSNNVDLLNDIDKNLHATKKITLTKEDIQFIISTLLTLLTLFYTYRTNIKSGEKTDKIIANQKEANEIIQKIDEKEAQTNELLEAILCQLEQTSSDFE